MKRPKVALVHDYLYTYGGAERVLSSFVKMFPDAPIFTLLTDPARMGAPWKEFEKSEIHTTWFGKLPYSSRLISPFRFLLPTLWKQFNFSDYDILLTSAAWAVTKGLRKGKNAKEICYLHTPPRWLYGYDTSRDWSKGWFNTLVRGYVLVVGHFLRQYDFQQAQKVDYFIVNSKNIGERVKKFYRRDDYTVIYPPVDIGKFMDDSIRPIEGDYYLTGGRMLHSKNFDLIIKAAKKAKVRLKIYGTGIIEGELRALKDSKIEFLGRISDEELIAHYKGAKAFIAAQKDEDFGITLVEAQASGCPVIAYNGGGYKEAVVEGTTGIFFDELSVAGIVKAIRGFKKMKFAKKACIENAKKFSSARFEKEITSFISTLT